MCVCVCCDGLCVYVCVVMGCVGDSIVELFSPACGQLHWTISAIAPLKEGKCGDYEAGMHYLELMWSCPQALPVYVCGKNPFDQREESH